MSAVGDRNLQSLLYSFRIAVAYQFSYPGGVAVTYRQDFVFCVNQHIALPGRRRNHKIAHSRLSPIEYYHSEVFADNKMEKIYCRISGKLLVP
jgi:hypothetical protein